MPQIAINLYYGMMSGSNVVVHTKESLLVWPSGNTLAFNAEDPGSTPGPGVR